VSTQAKLKVSGCESSEARIIFPSAWRGGVDEDLNARARSFHHVAGKDSCAFWEEIAKYTST
jgi:hypothetical protein